MIIGTYSQAGKIAGREALRIHPADAAERGIATGDVVRVFNDARRAARRRSCQRCDRRRRRADADRRLV